MMDIVEIMILFDMNRYFCRFKYSIVYLNLIYFVEYVYIMG